MSDSISLFTQLLHLAENKSADPGTIVTALSQGEFTPVERAALGRILAQLGDPRTGVGITGAHEPDITWIAIPEGDFLMGSEPAVDAEAKERETPQHSVYLPGFWISRYPVTVAQYALFVQSGGYSNVTYWSERGWQWKGERYHPEIAWLDPVYHQPNQPVIGVTWFEAQAYSRWLSERLDLPIRLPSEAEWEKAARGTDGRLYPYGNAVDETRFNGEGSQIGSPCAVGLFPSNQAPYEVLDMCGNVFEWTSSLLRDYPYDSDDGREDPSRHGSRIFRGGSFNTPAPLARCAFRSHFYPHGCYDWVGFRLCRDG